jgi:hypothetical protein
MRLSVRVAALNFRRLLILGSPAGTVFGCWPDRQARHHPAPTRSRSSHAITHLGDRLLHCYRDDRPDRISDLQGAS